jgi:hypothetical protein
MKHTEEEIMKYFIIFVSAFLTACSPASVDRWRYSSKSGKELDESTRLKYMEVERFLDGSCEINFVLKVEPLGNLIDENGDSSETENQDDFVIVSSSYTAQVYISKSEIGESVEHDLGQRISGKDTLVIKADCTNSKETAEVSIGTKDGSGSATLKEVALKKVQ